MSQYKVRNWSQYNESLKKRGSLSLWITGDWTFYSTINQSKKTFYLEAAISAFLQ